MRYRVRGPLHADMQQIATELRGFVAHTGAIRLSYLQMHGVAAHTIDVRDEGAAFFEETVLPKIGAAGSFVEQRAALRQPKELTLTATLCPATATSLPDLSAWGGAWSEVRYGPRRTTVRLRCLPEDADRLRALASQGWRVLRGPAAPLAWLGKAAPFAAQFWPSQLGCAAAPALASVAAAAAPGIPMPADLAPAAALASAVTASDVLAAPDSPNLLLGVTPTGQGVRLAWRSMIVAVQDAGERQDAVIPAMLARALTQGMGALVIAERAKLTPRALVSLASRLRLIDMADPWESARLPWRSLPPEGLKLLLGGSLPSPLPETLADALRAAGRSNLATPVLEALTSGEPDDLVGALEAGGGVVLLVEPGASASLLASLLILHLSLASLTRPLLICRPASLPIPPALADRAVQFVFGDVPTAALQLQATPDGWAAHFPDGLKITLQENLAAPVEERAGADHAALAAVLAGTSGGVAPTADPALALLGWPDEGAESPAAAPLVASLDWPDARDEDDEADAGLTAAADEGGVGLDWPDALEGDEADAGLTAAADTVDGDAVQVIAADADELAALGDFWEPVIDVAAVPAFDVDAWPALLLDDARGTTVAVAHPRRRVAPQRRRSLPFHTSGAGRHEDVTSGRTAAADTAYPPLAAFVTDDTEDMSPLAHDARRAAAAEEDAAMLPHADDVAIMDAEWPATLDASDEADLGLDWPASWDDGDAPGAGRAAAADEADALTLAADEADLGLDWPASLDDGDAPAARHAAAADEDAPTLAAPVVGEAPDTRIAELIAAWHGGASLSDVARELRRRVPTLSLLDAMQTIQAAIHGEGSTAAPRLGLSVTALVAPVAPPVPGAERDDLVEQLRGLAAVEPVRPAARVALRRWRDGGQRRAVVREVAVAYGMKEADARALYDRVILPHVINDLNGSAAEVLRFLRESPSDQRELPPGVIDCVARLIGNRGAHSGTVRPMLPALREALADLAAPGDA